MKTINFKSYHEAEDYLNKEYSNKIIALKYYTTMQQKTFFGKVDRLAIDTVLHNPPVVIIIFNSGERFEIDKDEIFQRIKKLN